MAADGGPALTGERRSCYGLNGGQQNVAAESDNGMTGIEAQVASLRVQGKSYRRISEELGIGVRTAWMHAHKPHVARAIREGVEAIVSGTADQLLMLRSQAIEVLRATMDEAGDEALRVQAAREVLKVTEPRKAEVKVNGVGDLIRAAVREMSDEELGVCDD